MKSILNLGITSPDFIADVIKFQQKFGIEIADKPVLNEDAVRMRMRFLQEELDEVKEAFEARDLVEIADGIADIIYVAIGAALQLGIPLGLVWDEVQRSNMDKVKASESESWKHCVKPPGWVGPKVAEVLALAGYVAPPPHPELPLAVEGGAK